ncbi:hypothetical protein [Kineosporia sp. R_H_3]|uniref:hypothetical protein n=1 Tax=Kineosporia sp. R_H_3 TaxID=1961848 RepID=UPI0018E992DE|nr:hypothetical protein [Kineosporia sp. R_H_3]
MRRVPGIFLDRGELEALLDVESAFNQPAALVQQYPGPMAGGYGYEGGHPKRR